jgi:hypothetical protein
MAAIRYSETFKRKASVSGYIFKGFYYQYGLGDIYASEQDAIRELQTASTLKTASSMRTDEGFCLTITEVEDFRTDYRSVRIWCKDLMQPEVGLELARYQLVGAIEFQSGESNPFENGVNNMVFLQMTPNCSIILDNDTGINHILGSDMDKNKYANATDKDTFLEMSSARRLLMDDRVSRFREKDVFQIATSGLIKI